MDHFWARPRTPWYNLLFAERTSDRHSSRFITMEITNTVFGILELNDEISAFSKSHDYNMCLILEIGLHLTLSSVNKEIRFICHDKCYHKLLQIENPDYNQLRYTSFNLKFSLLQMTDRKHENLVRLIFRGSKAIWKCNIDSARNRGRECESLRQRIYNLWGSAKLFGWYPSWAPASDWFFENEGISRGESSRVDWNFLSGRTCGAWPLHYGSRFPHTASSISSLRSGTDASGHRCYWGIVFPLTRNASPALSSFVCRTHLIRAFGLVCQVSRTNSLDNFSRTGFFFSVLNYISWYSTRGIRNLWESFRRNWLIEHRFPAIATTQHAAHGGQEDDSAGNRRHKDHGCWKNKNTRSKRMSRISLVHINGGLEFEIK